MWCRHPTNSSPAGRVKSSSSPALDKTSSTSRRSLRTTAVVWFCAISASACTDTTGSLSTYTTRASGARLGDLMDVRAARQPAADVDELADPGIAQEADRAHQELAVAAYGVQDLRHHVQHLVGGCPVRGEVVLTAQPVVIYPGRVRDV